MEPKWRYGAWASLHFTLLYLLHFWPPSEDEKTAPSPANKLHKVESSRCQLRVHAADRPLIWPPANYPKRSPRVCAASTLGALGSWRVGSPTAIANRRNTISPLTDGFRKKKISLGFARPVFTWVEEKRGQPNVCVLAFLRYSFGLATYYSFHILL